MSDYIPAQRGKNKEAERLKRLRVNRKWSQRDLAEEFKVSPGTIALWEQGDRSIPGPVIKLMEIYEKKRK